MLIDQHNRIINYLRLSVTDKCNLRCFYCMPEEGIPFYKKDKVLSYEEMLRICSLLTTQGVSKIRITGGEPFARRDMPYFLQELAALKHAPELSMTTNAVLIGPHISLLKSIGLTSINVSLDTLDKQRFFEITRRDKFQEVYNNLLALISEGFEVKLNCVVMKDKNIEDLVPLAAFTRNKNVSMRFLEEMPFDGQSGKRTELHWSYRRIEDYLTQYFGPLERLQDPPNSTAQHYRIKGFKGTIGIIPSFSRTFCGSCNRIRLSANGDFRTCLYGPAALNLRDELRQGYPDDILLAHIQQALNKKPKDGFQAEEENSQLLKNSMAHLGG